MSIEKVVNTENIVRRTSTMYKNVYLLKEKEYFIELYSIDI